MDPVLLISDGESPNTWCPISIAEIAPGAVFPAELSFEVDWEPTGDLASLFTSRQRRMFENTLPGSTFRAEYSALPDFQESGVLSLRDITFIEVTPADFHEGAD